MTESAAAHELVPQKSQADLIYEAQVKKQRRFRLNVAISWGILLLFLLFLFSGTKVIIDSSGTDVSAVRYEKDALGSVHKVDKSFLHLPIALPSGRLEFTTITLDQVFISDNLQFVAGGIGQTILISFVSILAATILGLLAALGRLSTVPPVYAVCSFYVSLIRGTPLYLQIFFFFLALPQLGIDLPGYLAGMIALALNYGAYMSEVFRAALSSVGKGQREAAMALGMTPNQTMQRIVLPQALRFALPPIGNDFISMLKDSALVSATGFVHELMWRSTKVGRANFRNLEALIMAAIFYWIMTLIFSSVQSRIETRLSKGDR